MRVIKTLSFLVVVFLCFSFVDHYVANRNVKCMIQLINYEGEGAYITVSVVDPNGNYLKTLRVLGDDEEWYPDLASWWTYYKNDKYPIDGITGATISGGGRSIFAMSIEEGWVGKGNILRFETAVEDQKYHEKDLEIALTDENLNTKLEGTGYIRYVRLITSTTN